jgi:hypothetical protein
MINEMQYTGIYYLRQIIFEQSFADSVENKNEPQNQAVDVGWLADVLTPA